MNNLTQAELELFKYRLGLITRLFICKTETGKCDKSCVYCIVKNNRPHCTNI